MARKRKNTIRLLMQWGIMLLLGYMVLRWWIDPNYIPDFEAYCPFGGMQAFTSFLVNNSLACTMTEDQIFMGILLLGGIFVFGKLFCSYICPIGTFTEWLGRIGDKYGVRISIKGIWDNILRSLKYILLFITFYFTVTSSELFCREYDPYYAAFTGFGHDVVWLYALIALAVTILGSVFIRQFWCKYLCPLGAISNIFANGLVFLGVMAVYLGLLAIGLQINWLWPAGIIIFIAMLLETTRLKGWLFPAFKITRNAQSCVNCDLCNKACPMGLEIMRVDTVEHIDCHLCTDCITACPVPNTLTINKKRINWVPAGATVGLIILGFILAGTIELPTINMKWAPKQKFKQAAVFSQSGIKNIKCFGSSKSFASKMQHVPGVLGVETYVRSHTAKIYYDPKVISDEGIKKAIFTPSKTLIKLPPKGTDSVSVLVAHIDNLFDTYDTFYLTQLLRQTKGIYGFSSQFGEPVKVRIYFDERLQTPSNIKKVIEQPRLTYLSRGKKITREIDFRVADMQAQASKLSRSAFIQQLFVPYDRAFNKYRSYNPQELAVYKIFMPQAISSGVRRSISMLVSHLSSNDYIVRFKTIYSDAPYALVYFVKNKVQPDEIYSMLTSPVLTVHYRNGKTGKVRNVFRFPRKGEVIAVIGKPLVKK